MQRVEAVQPARALQCERPALCAAGDSDSIEGADRMRAAEPEADASMRIQQAQITLRAGPYLARVRQRDGMHGGADTEEPAQAKITFWHG